MPSSWDRIEALFAEALTHEEPERTRWLLDSCGDDTAVFEEVAAMLAAHERPLAIEPRLLAGDAADPALPLLGTNVGPYRLLEPLGHGGMGSVWLAEHADGVLERKVAVKLVRRPHTAEEARMLHRRFEAERRILARLLHPGIVRLLEAGTATPTGTTGGYPYFAMDFVAGRPLTAFAHETGLSVRERLQLFVQVCDAVHHAHQRLVIHRDLKPSNILVTDEDDGPPQVKLLDFGIARLLDDEGLLTETGLRPMTRAYAAPEQIRGEPATTATDVYALGVVLYELLTGLLPFDDSTASRLEQAILGTEPTRPSVAVRSSGAGPGGTGPGGNAAGGNAAGGNPAGAPEPQQLRGDLDAIVLKALRKEPEARYGSAEALAADIRRHLDGLPVSARAPSAGYRLRSFVRRHRTGVAVAAAALILLVSFTVALVVQQRATERERDTAQATAAFLEGLFGAANPLGGSRDDTLRVADVLERGVVRARLELADQPLVRARLLHVIGRSFVRLGTHPRAEEPLMEAVALARQEGDRLTLARSLVEFAAVRNAQWRLAEAEDLALEALALSEQIGDPALRARAEHVMSLVLIDAGRPQEGEALLRTSIARLQTEPEDGRLLAAEQTLARSLFDQGRLEAADSLLSHLRVRITDLYGPSDTRLIGVLNPLTFLYLATGRLEEAEAVGSDVLALSRDALPGSGLLAQTLATYASILRRLGRLEEAETLLLEAIALPPMRPASHAVPFGTLATVRHERGNLTGAIDAQQSAVSLLQNSPTGNAASALFSEKKLARFLMEAGRFSEAEEILLTADAASAGPGAHPGSRPTAAELVNLYERWGRPDSAAVWRTRLDE